MTTGNEVGHVTRRQPQPSNLMAPPTPLTPSHPTVNRQHPSAQKIKNFQRIIPNGPVASPPTRFLTSMTLTRSRRRALLRPGTSNWLPGTSVPCWTNWLVVKLTCRLSGRSFGSFCSLASCRPPPQPGRQQGVFQLRRASKFTLRRSISRLESPDGDRLIIPCRLAPPAEAHPR